MKFGLPQQTLDQLYGVFTMYPELDEVIIYGSRAKGNYRVGSDIDIALKGEQITPEMRSSIWLQIDDLNTPYLFDISIYHTIDSPALLEHIDRVGQSLYKSEKLKAKLSTTHQTN